MRIPRGATALVLAVGLTAGLGACSGAKPSADKADPAASTTESAPAEAAAKGGELTTETFAATIGNAMADAGTVVMTMVTEDAGIKATTSTQIDVNSGNAVMTMSTDDPSAAGMNMETRLIDGKVYMSMGELTQNKFWEVTTDGPLDTPDSNNPAESIKQLEGSLKSVTRTGSESVDGVDTDVYEVVVDTTNLSSMFGADTADIPDLPSELSYTYWVDENNLARKLVVDLMGTEMVMAFSKWGEPLEIVAPSPEEITTEPPF